VANKNSIQEYLGIRIVHFNQQVNKPWQHGNKILIKNANKTQETVLITTYFIISLHPRINLAIEINSWKTSWAFYFIFSV
jgi:hypothetical protein